MPPGWYASTDSARERTAAPASIYRVGYDTLTPTLGAPSLPPRCRPAGTPAPTARRRRTPPRAAAPARAARTRRRSPTRCAPAPSAPGARARARACHAAGASAPGALSGLRRRAWKAKGCSTRARAPRGPRMDRRPPWLRPCHERVTGGGVLRVGVRARGAAHGRPGVLRRLLPHDDAVVEAAGGQQAAKLRVRPGDLPPPAGPSLSRPGHRMLGRGAL